MGQCLSPFKKDGTFVPCGKCYECKQRRASGWSFRLNKEAEISSAFFVTLTYDTDHVPITPRGYMSLQKTDLQKFFKRLRKNEQIKCKYYAVGEYGSTTLRPHYHIILFYPLGYTAAAVEANIRNAWKKGEIHIGTCTPASVGYTLKYISKGRQIPQHRNDDREPEKSLMSKRLGSNYLSKRMVKWHKEDKNNRMYCNLLDGKKITMPRYFKEKLYTKAERLYIQTQYLKKQAVENSKKTYEEKIQDLATLAAQSIIKGKKKYDKSKDRL